MNIQEAIERLAKGEMEIYSKVCVVNSVNKEDNTIEVSPLDKTADILDVKLQTDEGSINGFINYPVVGSNVIVSFLDKETAFVSLISSIEETVFNGGKNGGLVNINTLISELEKNNAILDAIIQTFANFIPVPNDGGAALKTAMNSALSGKQVGDFSDMEDEKFKH